MFHLSRKSRHEANAAELRKSGSLTRRCPHCGAELLWEMDEFGLYVAMDYDSDPHKPHILTCPNPTRWA